MNTWNRRQLLGSTGLSFACSVMTPWLLWSSQAALAQHQHASIAVPFYRPLDAAMGLYRHWMPPRAQALVDRTRHLHLMAQKLHRSNVRDAQLVLTEARRAWLQALDAWEHLATVPLGPLIERRSVRQIDFAPTRPALIQRAMQQAPSGAQAMARIGTPAKGLPALEWLWWAQPVRPGSAATAYAVEVASELEREAISLALALASRAQQEWDENLGNAAWSEFINQWIAALARLRWAQMEKPWREHQTRTKSTTPTADKAAFPRRLSAATADSWARQWQVLRDLAIASDDTGPPPGQGVVSIETYLRGRGLNALADTWVQRILQSDAAMATLQEVNDGPGLWLVSRELAQTQRLAEDDVAAALEVSIGFSDADGD